MKIAFFVLAIGTFNIIGLTVAILFSLLSCSNDTRSH